MGFSAFFKKLYPFLATASAVGGPPAMLAANALGQALGVTVQPDKIEDALTRMFGDPEKREQLAQVEADFQLQMKKLGFENEERLEEIAAADRASARAREIAVRDNTPKILAYLTITLTFFAEGWLLIHGQPRNIDGVVLGRVMGTLDAALIMVLSYFYGSSAGSAKKTDMISEQLEKT